MAGDMILLMRGLAKLSQAVMETQANVLRSGGAQALAQSVQMTAEQGLSTAMQKIQVGLHFRVRGHYLRSTISQGCVHSWKYAVAFRSKTKV